MEQPKCRIGRCDNLRFFMIFFNDDKYFGNYDLLDKPVVSFLAANDTLEELWSRVEEWLENEIFGTDKAILSHFETPFERRVLQLLLERNHPRILFTYASTNKASFRELKVSRTNPNSLVLRYRPLPDAIQWRQNDMLCMTVVNLADEVVTVGVSADTATLAIVEECKRDNLKPCRSL